MEDFIISYPNLNESLSLFFKGPETAPLHWTWAHLYSPAKFYWAPYYTPFSELHFVTYSILAYLLVLPLLQAWMKDRPAFKLTGLIRVHNLILCLWSLAMVVGTAIGVYLQYKKQGWWSVVCAPADEYVMHGFFYYWGYLYYLSKYYELLDTIILILKKKELIFLHVFHHSSMVLVGWVWLYSNWSFIWWGTFSNAFIHVFMYYYYFVATLGYSPWWKKYLTRAQIVQFLLGIAFTFYFMYTKLAYPKDCNGDLRVAVFSECIFFSFLALFLNFYVHEYKTPKKVSQKQE